MQHFNKGGINLPIINDKLFNQFLVLIFIITFFISITLGIIFFILLLFIFKKVSYYGFLFPLLIISIVAFTQYSTPYQGDYDIIRYYSYYTTLSNSNFAQASLLIIISGDYFFYSIVYILSQLFPNDPRILSFFFSFITGCIMLFTYRNIANYCIKENYIAQSTSSLQLLFWIIGFIGFINFPNYTNAYRQFFATAFFFWGFSRSLLQKKYIYIFLIALISHWSVLMYIIPFIFLKNRLKLLYISIILAAIIGATNLTTIFNLDSFNKVTDYTSEEVLGVDRTLMLVLFLSITSLFLAIHWFDKKKKKLHILPLTFLFWDFFFLQRSTVLIRLSFGFTQIYAILFPLLLSYDINCIYKRNIRILLFISSFFIISYNIKSICLSDFSYLIFSEYGFDKSIFSILYTSFPSEMI